MMGGRRGGGRSGAALLQLTLVFYPNLKTASRAALQVRVHTRLLSFSVIGHRAACVFKYVNAGERFGLEDPNRTDPVCGSALVTPD